MKSLSRFYPLALIMLLTGICLPEQSKAALLGSTGAQHGTTTVTTPAVLLDLKLDNYGKVSGTGSTVTVAHSDQGMFCSKVASVSAGIAGQSSFSAATPTSRSLNLCSFNAHDAMFDFTLSALVSPSVTSFLVGRCTETTRTSNRIATSIPWLDSHIQVNLMFNNGGSYSERHSVPPVMLDCAPCPPISIILKSPITMHDGKPVNIPLSSIATGGIPPYTVYFKGLPSGVAYQNGSLTGQPARGNYKGFVEVRDSCKSGFNSVWKNIDFYVHDSTPPKILTAFATPASLAWNGGHISLETRVTDNSGIGYVEAVISTAGTETKTIPLLRSVGSVWDGIWKGQFMVPTNSTAQDIGYKVSFRASDTDGNKAAEDNSTSTVVVVAKDKVPPRIVSFSVAPGTVPPEGGAVTVSVNATDNLGLQSVTMYLTRPDGNRSALKLIQTAGTPQNGEWKATWQMPVNTVNSQLQYGVQVAAYDLAGNLVTSQTTTLLVLARTPIQMPAKPGQSIQPGQPIQPATVPLRKM